MVNRWDDVILNDWDYSPPDVNAWDAGFDPNFPVIRNRSTTDEPEYYLREPEPEPRHIIDFLAKLTGYEPLLNYVRGVPQKEEWVEDLLPNVIPGLASGLGKAAIPAAGLVRWLGKEFPNMVAFRGFRTEEQKQLPELKWMLRAERHPEQVTKPLEVSASLVTPTRPYAAYSEGPIFDILDMKGINVSPRDAWSAAVGDEPLFGGRINALIDKAQERMKDIIEYAPDIFWATRLKNVEPQLTQDISEAISKDLERIRRNYLAIWAWPEDYLPSMKTRKLLQEKLPLHFDVEGSDKIKPGRNYWLEHNITPKSEKAKKELGESWDYKRDFDDFLSNLLKTRSKLEKAREPYATKLYSTAFYPSEHLPPRDFFWPATPPSYNEIGLPIVGNPNVRLIGMRLNPFDPDRQLLGFAKDKGLKLYAWPHPPMTREGPKYPDLSQEMESLVERFPFSAGEWIPIDIRGLTYLVPDVLKHRIEPDFFRGVPFHPF